MVVERRGAWDQAILRNYSPSMWLLHVQVTYSTHKVHKTAWKSWESLSWIFWRRTGSLITGGRERNVLSMWPSIDGATFESTEFRICYSFQRSVTGYSGPEATLNLSYIGAGMVQWLHDSIETQVHSHLCHPGSIGEFPLGFKEFTDGGSCLHTPISRY